MPTSSSVSRAHLFPSSPTQLNCPPHRLPNRLDLSTPSSSSDSLLSFSAQRFTILLAWLSQTISNPSSPDGSTPPYSPPIYSPPFPPFPWSFLMRSPSTLFLPSRSAPRFRPPLIPPFVRSFSALPILLPTALRILLSCPICQQQIQEKFSYRSWSLVQVRHHPCHEP